MESLKWFMKTENGTGMQKDYGEGEFYNHQKRTCHQSVTSSKSSGSGSVNLESPTPT